MTSSGAILILTGNAVGKTDKKLAFTVLTEVSKIAFVIWILQTTLLMFAENPILNLFTNDTTVITEMQRVWPFFQAFNLFFAYQILQSGFIRGVGNKIGVAAILVATGYVLVGVPLAYVFAKLMQMGLVGIWTAACCSSFFLGIG